MSPARRDIAPFLQSIRNFLLGRKHKSALRFQDKMSARTQPKPNIPKESEFRYECYYYTRNPRSKVAPPIDLIKQKLLAAAAKPAADAKQVASAKPAAVAKPAAAAKLASGLPTPGKVHIWD